MGKKDFIYQRGIFLTSSQDSSSYEVTVTTFFHSQEKTQETKHGLLRHLFLSLFALQVAMHVGQRICIASTISSYFSPLFLHQCPILEY